MTDESESLDNTTGATGTVEDLIVKVRRLHRRDLNRVWEFLKRVFRDVNRETVEYQRPRTKQRFLDVYEQPGIEQLLFEVEDAKGKNDIVGYAECAFQISGSDNWMNERYFTRREMRPMFVEELAVSPDYQGRGIGSFILEQLEHLARVRGSSHLVLEVAENNKRALHFYRARHFQRLDAAIFLAKKLAAESELLPARTLAGRPGAGEDPAALDAEVDGDDKDVKIERVPSVPPPSDKSRKKPKKTGKEGKNGKGDREAKSAKDSKDAKSDKGDKRAKSGKKLKSGKPAV